MRKRLLSFLVAWLGVAVLPGAARAQQDEPVEAEVSAQDVGPEAPPGDPQSFPYGPPPIPPAVEEEAVAGSGGSYCYMGGHPVDTRVAPGSAWDDQTGAHVHFYPPFDM